MAKTKKDDVDSFSGMFLGDEKTDSHEEPKQESKAEKGRPVENREKRERKSLSILPSIYDNAAKIAYVDRTSISEIVSSLLEDYITQNQDKLTEYDRIKK